MKLVLARFLGVLAIAATLSSCGGGTDGTGAVPPPTTNVTSSGVMAKGSVILNGTRFEPAGATIVDDRGRTAAQLESGMVIKLRGRSDDHVTGLADRIDVENEARGRIESIDAAASPRRLTLAGLVVLIDDQTVFANLAGFGSLAAGQRIEVHGLRDSAGLLHASRVEAVGATDGADELRGAVSNLAIGNDRFSVNGTVTVHYGGATFSPAGASAASLANGITVEVRGTLSGNVFTATQVEIEDLEDVPFQGEPGEDKEVEGFVTGFTAHPGQFQVNGRAVRTTSTTRFAGGTADDLGNDVEVEVEGELDSQRVLAASKVQFNRTRVILQGLATAVDATARTLTVLTQTVRVDDVTRINARQANGAANSDQLSDVVANVDCVEVRGHVTSTGLLAERIRELNQCNADVLQANVVAKDDANASLRFFGSPSLTATLPANANFTDAEQNDVTRAAFLALIRTAGANSPGTLVKLRGAFTGGTFMTDEAAIKSSMNDDNQSVTKN
jgi:hypothetical protein